MGFKLGALKAADAVADLPLLHVRVAQALLYSVPASGNAVAFQNIKIKQQKHESYQCHLISYKEKATEFLSFPQLK